MGGPAERIRQFREARVRPTAEDYRLARSILDGDELYALFAGQEPRDIVHGVRTARWLQERGHADHSLMLAALLHDIGKGRQRTRDRVAWVVAQGLRIERRAAHAESGLEVRRAMARSALHSERGAAMLEAAGAPEIVVELTRLHHDEGGQNGMLLLLQAADAAS